MKAAINRPIVALLALTLLTVSSCSKKGLPAPEVISKAVLPVYDERNNASMYRTTGLLVDASGNVYVADVTTNVIRKITPADEVTVIAGGNSSGSANGMGTAASFNIPAAMAFDTEHNIYVADAGNNLIRKVTPAGLVSTVAGSGARGSADGAALTASFNFPQGIAVDKAGNIYVADTGNDLIRKITPDGTVSTLAGKPEHGYANGAGNEATFNIPQGMAVESKGNVYVADAGNNLVRKITPSGLVSTFAGNGVAGKNDGPGVMANFKFPDGLTIDALDNLYVVELDHPGTRQIAPSGIVTTLDLKEDPGFNPARHVVGAKIDGIALDAANKIYLADIANNIIRKFSY